jgi:hypothetical protein
VRDTWFRMTMLLICPLIFIRDNALRIVREIKQLATTQTDEALKRLDGRLAAIDNLQSLIDHALEMTSHVAPTVVPFTPPMTPAKSQAGSSISHPPAPLLPHSDVSPDTIPHKDMEHLCDEFSNLSESNMMTSRLVLV